MEFLRHYAVSLTAFGFVFLVALTGGLLTTIGPWYRSLRKPAWQPPDWLFGPAWTSIFILEALAGVRAWHAAPDPLAATLLMTTYVINGLLNILWSLLFFARRRPDHALWEVGPLWLSVLAMMLVIAPYAGSAWLLLLPYLLWVGFAAYLNYTIVRLNAPFAAPA